MEDQKKSYIEKLIREKQYFIFDLDWVIIDIESINFESYKELISHEFSHKLNIFDYDKYFKWTRFNDSMKRFMENELNINLSEYDLSMVWNRMKRIKKDLISSAAEITVIDWVLEFLQHLKISGKTIWLATSTIREFTFILLERIWLKDFFKTVVWSEDVTIWKPDPEIFRKAFHALGWKEGDSWVVFEDSINWVRAAIAGWFTCIWIWKTLGEETLRNQITSGNGNFFHIWNDFEYLNNLLWKR